MNWLHHYSATPHYSVTAHVTVYLNPNLGPEPNLALILNLNTFQGYTVPTPSHAMATLLHVIVAA